MMIWEELYSSSQKEEILDLEQWQRQKNSILFWKMKKRHVQNLYSIQCIEGNKHYTVKYLYFQLFLFFCKAQ